MLEKRENCSRQSIVELVPSNLLHCDGSLPEMAASIIADMMLADLEIPISGECKPGSTINI
jgi:hypothetical protein